MIGHSAGWMDGWIHSESGLKAGVGVDGDRKRVR